MLVNLSFLPSFLFWGEIFLSALWGFFFGSLPLVSALVSFLAHVFANPTKNIYRRCSTVVFIQVEAQLCFQLHLQPGVALNPPICPSQCICEGNGRFAEMKGGPDHVALVTLEPQSSVFVSEWPPLRPSICLRSLKETFVPATRVVQSPNGEREELDKWTLGRRTRHSGVL